MLNAIAHVRHAADRIRLTAAAQGSGTGQVDSGKRCRAGPPCAPGRAGEAQVVSMRANGGHRGPPPSFLRSIPPTPCQVSAKKTVGNAVKVCKHCGQRKESREFRRNPGNRDGLSSWCSECHNEATRRWREANRDKINAARRVVPRYVYDPGGKTYVPNPSSRPKSKVR